jgi:EmrB/QacA subfamily drug resistance transporter
LLVTLGFFATGSLVAALSHSIGVLVAGRAIQGVGGAVFPLAFGIIRDEFPPEKVATAIGLISATFGIGGGFGLVLSGVIVDHLAYEWIFWLALAFVAVAIVATRLFVPESPVKSPAKIDWLGAGLLSSGLVCLLFGLSEANRWGWGSIREIAMLVAAAGILLAWARFELHVADPLVDMRMMRRRAVLTTNMTAFLIGFGMFGSFIIIPQLVQLPKSTGFGFGANVTEAGLFLLPATLVMLFAGPVAGVLGTRLGSKVPLIAGTLFATLSFAFLAAEHEHRWAIYGATALMGLGIGFAFAAMANLIVEAVDQRETGVATGMNTIMRTIGGSLGGQISATILVGHLSGGYPTSAGFTVAFAVSAGVVLIAFVSALLIPGRQERAPGAEPAFAHR